MTVRAAARDGGCTFKCHPALGRDLSPAATVERETRRRQRAGFISEGRHNSELVVCKSTLSPAAG